jgi:N-carbamoyl-L-amino-acid hydrolase
MLASGVFAGVQFSLDYAYGRKDPDGKVFGDELKRIGWIGDETVGARKMHAYFEYHIEQGPILEAEGKHIGVVTHWQGLWWLEFTLTGKEAHTGSTPMKMRVNAGLAMARILEMVQTVAMENQPGAVGGVGQVFFSPNSRNVLPGKVVFTVDIRSPDQAKLDRMRARIEAEAAENLRGAGRRLFGRGGRPFRSGGVRPDPGRHRAQGRRRRSATAHMNIISGAGHDACWMAKGCAGHDDHVPLRRWASRTTRPRTFRRNGPARAPTCCCTRCGDGGDCHGYLARVLIDGSTANVLEHLRAVSRFDAPPRRCLKSRTGIDAVPT